MNSLEIRTAIAIATEWKDVGVRAFVDPNDPRYGQYLIGVPPENFVQNVPWRGYSAVPNYPNDLNAMHEAELTLTMPEHQAFQAALRALQCEIGGTPADYDRVYLSASAEDRAEAFLRVKGLWVERKPLPSTGPVDPQAVQG